MQVDRFIRNLLESASRSQLEAFLDYLFKHEAHDDEEGCHYWSPEVSGCAQNIQSGVCTNGAFLVKQKFGGKIFGYADGNNPTALAGRPSDTWDKDERNWGHDFCVVDNYIVDYWVYHFTGDYHKGVFDMRQDAEEIKRLYGDPSKWVEVSGRHDTTS